MHWIALSAPNEQRDPEVYKHWDAHQVHAGKTE